MDIALIGVTLGVFSGTALVGVFAQVSGRGMNFRTLPPDMVGALIIGVSLAFIMGYMFVADGFVEWAWWKHAVFMASNSTSAASGCVIGYTAMSYMTRDDED